MSKLVILVLQCLEVGVKIYCLIVMVVFTSCKVGCYSSFTNKNYCDDLDFFPLEIIL